MASDYSDIDLRFTWNGDFSLGGDGDLADTSDDLLESLKQELQTVSKSEAGDWEMYSSYASTLSDFVGFPNTKPTADAIHDRLRSAIISNSLVLEDDLNIKVIPVHRHKVLIIIRVNAVPVAGSSLEGNQLVTSLLFDFTE